MAYLDTINVNGNDYDLGKPIYYHPIYVQGTSFRFALAILDNNSTAYSTWSDILAKLKALMDLGALINTNGWVYVNSKGAMIYRICKDSNNYYIWAYSPQDATLVNVDLDTITPIYVNDGINKIN